MIKQARAGKPVDMDAIPPPVSTGAASQPSATASSHPAQAVPTVDDLDSKSKATKLDQDAISKPSGAGTCNPTRIPKYYNQF